MFKLIKFPIKNYLFILILILLFNSCKTSKGYSDSQILNEKSKIITMLDSFNIAAANADFEKYFSYYTEDAIFIGTDATEIWDKKAFMAYAKPHFDKKRAWNFKAVQRNIYFGNNKEFAWFDELLNTQMKICRGSGVLIKKDNTWKVQQYVLSMTIPNDVSGQVIKIKTNIEDSLLIDLQKIIK